MNAAFSHDRDRVDIGICICDCDDQGSYVLAHTQWLSPLLDVDEGEAMGLLFALRWVKELQLNNVSFEFDCKRMVDNFNCDRNDESDFGAIIRYCKNIFFVFTNLYVEFIDKQTRLLIVFLGLPHF